MPNNSDNIGNNDNNNRTEKRNFLVCFVVVVLLLFFCVPQLYLWGSPLLGEIFAYVTVF